jgi:hypothetical protein
MRNYQFPMEATMYATRAPKTDKEGNVDPSDLQARNSLRNILVAQAAGATTNAILDQFEPQQRKRDEEKDFGDRFRDVTRAVVNTAVPLISAAQMFGSLRNPSASTAEKVDATANTVQALAGLLEGGGGVNTQKQDLGGPQPAGPADNAYTQASEQELQRRGAEDYVQKSLFQQQIGQSPTPVTGNQDSLINRMRQAEEDTKLARSERMPGVMRDLNKQVDDDMAQRLAGLQREAAQYPKTTEIDYKAQGMQAGFDYLYDKKSDIQELKPSSSGQPVIETVTVSTNPLLRREPASSFAEEFGDPTGRRESSAEREKRTTQSLGEFYANIPADPKTGERNIDSFLVDYNEVRGAVEPRNTGELLSDQLKGETAFNQQQSREPFVQEQAADALNTLDEQGPEVPQMKAEAQKEDFMREALGRLGEAQAETQRQLMEMKNQTVVPTADRVPDYVKSDFLVPAPSKTLSSIGERLRKAELSIGGAPEEFGGDGFDVELPGSYRRYSVDSPAALAAFERAGVTRQEATDYWMDKMKSSGILESVRTLQEEDKPAIKKTTIIEEVQPSQQSTKPMDVAEKLRRIQTSGRPNARQEAQDFLASIKEQMSNG